MVIDISVQYNGGFLPDLLTQGYYRRGTGLNTMEWLCLIAYHLIVYYYYQTMFDGVLHCLCLVFTVFLVSLHSD